MTGRELGSLTGNTNTRIAVAGQKHSSIQAPQGWVCFADVNSLVTVGGDGLVETAVPRCVIRAFLCSLASETLWDVPELASQCSIPYQEAY